MKGNNCQSGGGEGGGGGCPLSPLVVAAVCQRAQRAQRALVNAFQESGGGERGGEAEGGLALRDAARSQGRGARASQNTECPQDIFVWVSKRKKIINNEEEGNKHCTKRKREL